MGPWPAKATIPLSVHTASKPQGKHTLKVHFDLDAWLKKHNIKTFGPEPYQGGTRWVCEVCPFDPTHTGGCAAFFQYADGTIGFKCHHNSCADKHWKDARALFEPDAYKRKWSRSPVILPGMLEAETSNHPYAPLLCVPEVDLPLILEALLDIEWGDSNLFAYLFAQRVVYDHREKKWYLYLVHFWQRDQTEFVKQLVAGVLASVYQQATVHLLRAIDDPNMQVEVQLEEEDLSSAR